MVDDGPRATEPAATPVISSAAVTPTTIQANSTHDMPKIIARTPVALTKTATPTSKLQARRQSPRLMFEVVDDGLRAMERAATPVTPAAVTSTTIQANPTHDSPKKIAGTPAAVTKTATPAAASRLQARRQNPPRGIRLADHANTKATRKNRRL